MSAAAELAQHATVILATVSVIGTIVSLGVVFGLLKGKVKEQATAIASNKELFEVTQNSLQRQVDSSSAELRTLKENNRLVEHYVEEKTDKLRLYVDSEIKMLCKDVQGIKSNCFVRQGNVDMVPSLAEKVKQLEIEIGVLPSKLSEELSKAFSEEYTKLVKTISNKYPI